MEEVIKKANKALPDVLNYHRSEIIIPVIKEVEFKTRDFVGGRDMRNINYPYYSVKYVKLIGIDGKYFWKFHSIENN